MLIKVPKADEMRQVPEPVAAGIYPGDVTHLKPGTSKAGNPKLDVGITLGAENVKGRMVWETLTFTDKAIWKVNDWHRALTDRDIPEGDYEVDELINLMSNLLTNAALILKVTLETMPPQKEGDEPKPVNKIAEVARR